MAGIRHDLIERVRRALGLSGYEARVYIALLLGARNPRDASTLSGVPLPRVYDIVKLLEAKGLVEKEPEGWYAPVPPRSAAAAVIAREEEELRRRARLAAEVVDELEELAGSTGSPRVSVVTGPGGLAAAVAGTVAPGAVVYVTLGPARERVVEAVSASVRAVGVGEIRVLGPLEPSLPPGIFDYCRTPSTLVDSVAGRDAAVFAFWDAETDSLIALTVRGWYAKQYYAGVEAEWRRCKSRIRS